MKIQDNPNLTQVCPQSAGQKEPAASRPKSESAPGKEAAKDRVSLSRTWPGGCTLAMEEASRIPDSGEAEARVLFARHQLQTEPGRAATAQANLDHGRALTILS